MRFCIQCGSQLEDDSKFCTFCGAPVLDAQVVAQSDETIVSSQEVNPEISQGSNPFVMINTKGGDSLEEQPVFGEQDTMIEPTVAQAPLQQECQQSYVNQNAYLQTSSHAIEKKKSKKVAIIVIICLLLLAGGGVGFWLLGPFSPFNTTQNEQAPTEQSQAEQAKNDISNKNVGFNYASPFYAVLYIDSTSSNSKVKSWTSQGEAQATAKRLTDEGYPAEAINGKQWDGELAPYDYVITFGTWETNAEAKDMAQLLQQTDVATTVLYSGNPAPAEESVPAADPNTVVLGIVSKGGERLVGTVHFRENEQVIPDSSTRLYTEQELAQLGLTDAELCIAWNEPFARLGYHFNNPDLNNYFQARSWYHDKGLSNSTLSGNAATNNTRLQKLADTNSSTSALWKQLSNTASY